MKIYVGNMSYGTTSEDLRSRFSEFGSVDSAEVVMDRYTNRSRGFGFVEMPDSEEARAAIDGLNGKEVDGRTLNVSEAKPRGEGTRGGMRSSSYSTPREGGYRESRRF